MINKKFFFFLTYLFLIADNSFSTEIKVINLKNITSNTYSYQNFLKILNSEIKINETLFNDRELILLNAKDNIDNKSILLNDDYINL